MNKIFALFFLFALSACSTKYILMDEDGNPVKEGYYTENGQFIEDSSFMSETVVAENEFYGDMRTAEEITANDVFVVGEGQDFVTYQYKNVRVDEISPLASLYCADVAYGGSPYLREVSMYHNGFMRATFDCVNLAI